MQLEDNIVPDTVYLYGVDYMSTNDIKTYLERYSSNKELLEVKWINDSSCTIKFESEELAKKTLTE